jgi:hypothetical protein
LHRIIPLSASISQGPQAIILAAAAWFLEPQLFGAMNTKNQISEVLGLVTKPAWANIWHLWTVFIPRRTITGELVWGKVWRRHDGRGWIYKRFVDLARFEG